MQNTRALESTRVTRTHVFGLPSESAACPQGTRAARVPRVTRCTAAAAGCGALVTSSLQTAAQRGCFLPPFRSSDMAVADSPSPRSHHQPTRGGVHDRCSIEEPLFVLLLTPLSLSRFTVQRPHSFPLRALSSSSFRSFPLSSQALLLHLTKAFAGPAAFGNDQQGPAASATGTVFLVVVMALLGGRR